VQPSARLEYVATVSAPRLWLPPPFVT